MWGLGIHVLKSFAASHPVNFFCLPKYVEPSSQTLQPITLELRRRKIPKGGEVPSKRPRIEKNLCEYFTVFNSHSTCIYKFLNLKWRGGEVCSINLELWYMKWLKCSTCFSQIGHSCVASSWWSSSLNLGSWVWIKKHQGVSLDAEVHRHGGGSDYIASNTQKVIKAFF